MTRSAIWVTGTGLVSGLGGTVEAHTAGLLRGTPAPVRHVLGIPVMPAAAVDLVRYVPNRIEQKRLGGMQALCICAAGDALAEAGLLGATDILANAAVLVGAMGGERDIGFDGSILADPQRYAGQAELNQRLVAGTRPSLLLSQLPNLLAGNISILFGVAGYSRTMIGEELAGVAAVQAAAHLLKAGRAEVALVGAGFVADREDLLWFFKAAGTLWRGEGAPPALPRRRGMVLGSAGAFLVLERAAHARARGVVPLASLASVGLHHCRHRPGALAALLAQEAAPASAILSGASGAMPVTEEELAALPLLPRRCTAALFGHAMEASFPLGVALASLALRQGGLWPPQPGDPPASLAGPPGSILVTGLGHRMGEGFALLERVVPAEVAR